MKRSLGSLLGCIVLIAACAKKRGGSEASSDAFVIEGDVALIPVAVDLDFGAVAPGGVVVGGDGAVVLNAFITANGTEQAIRASLAGGEVTSDIPLTVQASRATLDAVFRVPAAAAENPAGQRLRVALLSPPSSAAPVTADVPPPDENEIPDESAGAALSGEPLQPGDARLILQSSVDLGEVIGAGLLSTGLSVGEVSTLCLEIATALNPQAACSDALRDLLTARVGDAAALFRSGATLAPDRKSLAVVGGFYYLLATNTDGLLDKVTAVAPEAGSGEPRSRLLALAARSAAARATLVPDAFAADALDPRKLDQLLDLRTNSVLTMTFTDTIKGPDIGGPVTFNALNPSVISDGNFYFGGERISTAKGSPFAATIASGRIEIPAGTQIPSEATRLWFFPSVNGTLSVFPASTELVPGLAGTLQIDKPVVDLGTLAAGESKSATIKITRGDCYGVRMNQLSAHKPSLKVFRGRTEISDDWIIQISKADEFVITATPSDASPFKRVFTANLVCSAKLSKFDVGPVRNITVIANTPAALAIGAGAASHDFGDVLRSETKSVELAIKNSSVAPATLGDLSSSGVGIAAPFTVTGGTCATGAVLGDGESCTIAVTFAPTARGAATATLTLPYTDATGGGTKTLTLNGKGISSGPTTALLELPAGVTSYDYGTVASGFSVTKTLTYTNNGNSPATGLALTFSGNHSYRLTIVSGSDTCTGQSIAAGSSCSVDVRYFETGVGSLGTGKATMTYNDGVEAKTVVVDILAG